MFSYTVTIGRNVDGEPMPGNVWLRFIEDTIADMETIAIAEVGDVFETHHGLGTWNDVTEESVKVTVLTNYELEPNQLQSIRFFMSDNARTYNQDAIALTIGTTELC